MKRFLLFTFVILLSLRVELFSSFAIETLPTRIINVVYDDSGSMIKNDTGLVDTWCQAKYSMEVFAALLGEKDTMNVYVMSDYDGGNTTMPPRLTLYGNSGAEANVNKVHQMLTAAGNTPFNAVRKAYEDLRIADADEKWLVILTDGAFEDGAFTNTQVDDYLAQKEEDINVMFLGMGETAASITANEADNIFFEKAQSNDQILEKITGICTRVFNSNKLKVNVENGEFAFDIPMSSITVFAQGDDVAINGLTDSDGTDIEYDSKPVSVRYSEKPSSVGYANYITDDKLNGSIATFKGDFKPGVYHADVVSAKTIEVYYQPNVEIMLYLIDDTGAEVPYTDGVRSGEYEIRFGFVKAGTTEPVPKSDLLGDVYHSGQINYNNGQKIQECIDGNRVVIEEGAYRINARAEYLNYNTVSTDIEFEVYRDKELEIQELSVPEYVVDNEGIVNANEPIVLKITLEGNEINPVAWADFGIPTITQTSHTDNRVKFKVEKSEEIGVFNVFPVLTTEKPIIGDYGNIGFSFSAKHEEDKSTWSGEYIGEYLSTDTRSWIVRHADKFIKLTVLAAIIFLVLGYVPGFKKYLPKKLKKLPKIECESNTGAHKQWTANGRFTKDRLSTIIPYRAERGTIKYLPRGVSAGSNITVKAIGSNKMEITNTKAFAGKDYISFNGQSVQKGNKKNLSVTAGLRIKVETREANYSCALNK